MINYREMDQDPVFLDGSDTALSGGSDPDQLHPDMQPCILGVSRGYSVIYIINHIYRFDA